MTFAILCSGQGLQHPRMFDQTGDAPEAAHLFAEAASLLGGRDPRELVGSESSQTLHENRLGQVLCALQAVAAAAALKDALPPSLLVAGYSVGEVAAWSVAGLIEGEALIRLVAQRAEEMDAVSTSGDGLLYVRGLGRDSIDALCRVHDAAIAIVNPNDAYILGGSGAALDALAQEATRIGAVRAIRIGVNVASHTARLASASRAFRLRLQQSAIGGVVNGGVRLFSGVDAAPVLDVVSGMDKLAAQISQTIHWDACLQACVEAGASVFLELGPGRSLCDMAASAYPAIPARCLEDFRTLDGVRRWIARSAS